MATQAGFEQSCDANRLLQSSDTVSGGVAPTLCGGQESRVQRHKATHETAGLGHRVSAGVILFMAFRGSKESSFPLASNRSIDS